MKIFFRNLHLENFISFAEADIKLDNQGYTLIKGINNRKSDGALSNGSGKTTILEAINWALCGETIRGAKDIVNHFTEDGALVELDFDIDETSYKIIRTKDHSRYKTNLKLYVDGEDKSGKGIRDTEKILSQLLPDITSSLIGSVILLGQGLPQRFTNNTPSGRKDVLEKLSKSDFMVQDLKDKISKRKTDLSDDLRKAEDNILKGNTSQKMLEQQIDNAAKNLAELETSDVEEKKKEIESLDGIIFDLSTEYNKLKKENSECDDNIQSLYEEISKIESACKENISKIDLSKHDSLFSDYNKAIAEANSLLLEINRLESVSDVCPTCGQKLPGVVKIDTTEKKEELSELERKKVVLKEELDRESSAIALLKEEQEKEAERKKGSIGLDISKYKETKQNCLSQMSVIDSKKQDCQDKKSSLKTFVDTVESNKEVYKNLIIDAKEKLEKTKEEILYNTNEKVNIENHLSIVTKFYTIITRDFRGYLLQNIIKFIDMKSKEYAEFLFNNNGMAFELDGNNISISYDGKEYESLSGGEKQKVDLIVQFSIRDMLCKYLDFSSNILALDELTDNLDTYSAEKLFNLISKKLNDVESIYIISHHSDFSLPIDNEIVVQKGEDGISRIM